ncbi:MAG TPA: hypothetical protein DCF68_02670 [Cyanothece sp. UBA12306]|nr:hypothetical protein [Cyanothece sp. UBA12306]
MPEEEGDLLRQAQEKAEIKRIELEIKRIERGERIREIDDWIRFITLKTVGLVSLGIGGLEIILPSILIIVLAPPFTPFTLVGIGLALLTGQKSIDRIKSVVNILSKDDEDNEK